MPKLATLASRLFGYAHLSEENKLLRERMGELLLDRINESNKFRQMIDVVELRCVEERKQRFAHADRLNHLLAVVQLLDRKCSEIASSIDDCDLKLAPINAKAATLRPHLDNLQRHLMRIRGIQAGMRKAISDLQQTPAATGS